MKPAQNRTGSASASSHDSQDVTPGCRAAAQLDSSTLLPAPADPTTTVSRLLAPAVSRSSSADLVTRVVGSVVGAELRQREPRAARGVPPRRRRLYHNMFPAVPAAANAAAQARFVP